MISHEVGDNLSESDTLLAHQKSSKVFPFGAATDSPGLANVMVTSRVVCKLRSELILPHTINDPEDAISEVKSGIPCKSL